MIDLSKTKLSLPLKAGLSVLMMTVGCFSPLLYPVITWVSPDSFHLGFSVTLFTVILMFINLTGASIIWLLDENWRF